MCKTFTTIRPFRGMSRVDLTGTDRDEDVPVTSIRGRYVGHGVGN